MIEEKGKGGSDGRRRHCRRRECSLWQPSTDRLGRAEQVLRQKSSEKRAEKRKI